jgi:UDP:flavonoid glycosyltransferase YjiC (YdhE family)
MRVLFTTRGSAGHLGPLVPYAAACRSAGHDVLVAAQDRFEANVARTGLPFAPLGAPPDEEWMPLLPEFAQMRLDEGHDRMVSEFFGTLDVRAMLPGLRALVREWRPDLIVRESWEYTSPLVAEEHGIPIARIGLGVAAVEEVSDRAAGRVGTEPYLTSIPPALEDPSVPLPRSTLRFRGDEAPPSALGEGEPLVYVSFGSVTAGGHLPF